jgi:hypothetical protein
MGRRWPPAGGWWSEGEGGGDVEVEVVKMERKWRGWRGF